MDSLVANVVASFAVVVALLLTLWSLNLNPSITVKNCHEHQGRAANTFHIHDDLLKRPPLGDFEGRSVVFNLLHS
jgi:hypothetical protein